MKLSKSIGILGKTIGIEAIIGSIITVLLIGGIIIGVFSNNNYVWEDILNSSKKEYEYTSFDNSFSNGVDLDILELYKSARVLYSYSDLDNLSLENYSSENVMLYGWDKNNTKKLNDSIDSILEKVKIVKEKNSFSNKEKEALSESLKMIRYFCDNQQVIDKVRLELKLIGKTNKSNSSLNIEVIGDGGKELFDNYEEKLMDLRNILE